MGTGPATSVTGGNGTIIHAGTAPITLTAAGEITAEHLVTSGAVNVSSAAGTLVLHQLRNDIVTANADIVLNGQTMINPVVQSGEAKVVYSRLFRLRTAETFYEAPSVQVSLEMGGSGSVLLNGDVLWGGTSRAAPC